MTKFHIGLVGCGRISQSWIEAIRQSPNVQLVSIMDTNTALTQSITELVGCQGFDSLDAMIKHHKLDGAIVCTPPTTHSAIVCQLLEAGIPVLCEKPLAVTHEEGEKMYAMAKERDLVLMMASKFRYVEDIIRAKSIISSGMLGNIHFYQNQFCSQVNMAGRWNSDKQVSGGGVIMDNGPHSVDIIRYLMGPVQKIFAHESAKSQALDIEDTATLSLITKSNVIATVLLSWSLNIKEKSYIEIYGTDGALKIGWEESTYQYNGHPNWIPFGVGYQKVAAFKSQLLNFVNTVRGQAEPLINEEDSLHSIKLIEAAYSSMKSGLWVEV